MSSQIYARYVPPTKKNTPIEAPSITLTSKATSNPPPTSAVPATRPDASSTYTRYIPPSKPKVKSSQETSILDDVPTSNSKRKRDLEEGVIAEKKSKKSKVNGPTPRLEEQDTAKDDAKKGNKKPKMQEGVFGDSLIGAEVTLTKPKKERKSAPVNGDVVVEKAKKSKSRTKDDNEETRRNGDARDPTRNGKKEKPADDGEDEDARHERLMRKREKSLKKAEKLAENKDEDGDEIMAELVELHDLVPLPQPEPVPELPLSAEDALPSWLADPIRVAPTTTAEFVDLGLEDQVVKTLQNRGFQNAFAVQAAVLPLLLPKRTRASGDVLVSAATGSGKTLAYILPMSKDISRHRVSKMRGLIVLPTRELVSQAKEVAEMCASAIVGERRVKVGTAVGSDTLAAEQASLMQQELIYDPAGYRELVKNANKKWELMEDVDGGIECLFEEDPIPQLPDHIEVSKPKVDILICTPGRLVEHLKSTPGFILRDVSWLIVDEADKLLDQSYQQWLDVVMAGLSGRESDVRKVILSATMTRDIGQLTELKLYRPKLVVLEGLVESSASHVLPSLLVESAIKVEEDGIKPLYLMELLRRAKVISNAESSDSDSDTDSDSTSGSESMPAALIFTKSNEAAVRLGRLIALLAPSSSSRIGVLTSTLPRSSRQRTLQSFGNGKVSILVASDLVSRGLDLPNLAHVVNYDVPASLTSYVHRIGRTARAGKEGHAWTLFTGTEGRWFWHEIGRSEHVQRGRVERVNIKKETFGDEEREMYREALEELEKEVAGK